MNSKGKKHERRAALPAEYTVEAAGVMAVVLFVMMILFRQAFHVRAETVGVFAVHERVEQERHEIAHSDEEEISHEAQGQQWSVKITAPVFRPEDSLRMWSVLEETGED